MSEYQLEIKQIVDDPRFIRIYWQFVQTLMKDRVFALAAAPDFLLHRLYAATQISARHTSA